MEGPSISVLQPPIKRTEELQFEVVFVHSRLWRHIENWTKAALKLQSVSTKYQSGSGCERWWARWGGPATTGAAREKDMEGMMDIKGDTSAMFDWVKVEKTLCCQAYRNLFTLSRQYKMGEHHHTTSDSSN